MGSCSQPGTRSPHMSWSSAFREFDLSHPGRPPSCPPLRCSRTSALCTSSSISFAAAEAGQPSLRRRHCAPVCSAVCAGSPGLSWLCITRADLSGRYPAEVVSGRYGSISARWTRSPSSGEKGLVLSAQQHRASWGLGGETLSKQTPAPVSAARPMSAPLGASRRLLQPIAASTIPHNGLGAPVGDPLQRLNRETSLNRVCRPRAFLHTSTVVRGCLRRPG